ENLQRARNWRSKQGPGSQPLGGGGEYHLRRRARRGAEHIRREVGPSAPNVGGESQEYVGRVLDRGVRGQVGHTLEEAFPLNGPCRATKDSVGEGLLLLPAPRA